MRKILVIGSGKSTSYLIKYLLDKSTTENLHVIVGDINIHNAKKLIGKHENAQAIMLDVFDKSSFFFFGPLGSGAVVVWCRHGTEVFRLEEIIR